MTKEEKQLLLKDLCTRLPYKVKVQYFVADGLTTIDCGVDQVSIESECIGIFKDSDSKVTWRGIETIKPYLRPMSSMTEEEEKEFLSLESGLGYDIKNKNTIYQTNKIDWLNAHHFDYRGLIEKGLALEAPEGMYEN